MLRGWIWFLLNVFKEIDGGESVMGVVMDEGGLGVMVIFIGDLF